MSKKIIHILNQVNNCGNGIANVAFDLSCQQVKNGDDVYIISGGGSFEQDLIKNGVKHITISQDRNFLTILKALYAIHTKLTEIRPHIVHSHVMTGLIIMYIMKLFHRYSLVATVHNEFQRSSILMKYADKVIAVSQQVKDALVSRGVNKDKIFVVKNGMIGTLRNIDQNIDDIQMQRPSISTVAGLFHRKGIDVLIKAFILIVSKHPQAHLYIVGDGSERQDLETLVRQNKLSDRIHFMGFHKNIKGILKHTDIFVLPSRSEPFGLSLAEAREAGCAVIGSHVGGIPEVLDFGRAGQTFPVEDYQRLSQILDELLVSPENMMHWKNKSSVDIEWLKIARMTDQVDDIYIKH